jgi:hypothetical protein
MRLCVRIDFILFVDFYRSETMVDAREISIDSSADLLSRRNSSTSTYTFVSDFDDDDEAELLPLNCPSISLSKLTIHHILERQEGLQTLLYHLLVYVLTLFSLILGSISTIDQWQCVLSGVLYRLEVFLAFFFSVELVLRIWSAGCLSEYRGLLGRLAFIHRPTVLLDILTLFGFGFTLINALGQQEICRLSTLQLLLPLQILRLFRLDRQLVSWSILKGIIRLRSEELTGAIVISLMFLITGSYLIHISETPVTSPDKNVPFQSAADSLWFSIITVGQSSSINTSHEALAQMTTIGFGDLYPRTFVAKAITTTILVFGVAFWCVPACVIARVRHEQLLVEEKSYERLSAGFGHQS